MGLAAKPWQMSFYQRRRNLAGIMPYLETLNIIKEANTQAFSHKITEL